MRKKISLCLIFLKLNFDSLAYGDEKKYEFKFMDNAKRVFNDELTKSLPSFLTNLYTQDLLNKKFFLENNLRKLELSSTNLENDFKEIKETLYRLNEISIADKESFSEYLKSYDKLLNLKDNIKNNIYTYRNAENNFLESKNIMNNYCLNTSKLISAKSMTLEPTIFEHPDLSNLNYEKRDFFEKMAHDTEYSQSFIGHATMVSMAGATVTAIAIGSVDIVAGTGVLIIQGSVTGPGILIVLGAALATLIVFSIFSIFENRHKEKKEKERMEAMKRRMEKEFNEANDWYKQNTVFNKLENLQDFTYDLCDKDTYEFIMMKHEIQNNENLDCESLNDTHFKCRVDIPSARNNIKLLIDNGITYIRKRNNGVEYSLDDLKKLINLFDNRNSSVFSNKEFTQFNDTVSKNYFGLINEISKIEKNKSRIIDRISSILSKNEISIISNKIQSNNKTVKAIEALYQSVGNELSKNLYSIFLENINNCRKFKMFSNYILEDIDKTKDQLIINYMDEFNKDGVFFKKEIHEYIKNIHRINDVRVNAICGGVI
ncbi:hypothetical protein [Fluviispira multicolorata]|uniref:Uncharacterized protein n=1 Tax=Fluviispira multicolorata TaxID=2654512 RepID=A0A833JFB1_9BACT|nr:hypothetical protein [Fluviispira multicolorata]KAB8033651.1 hypothetical protein GCL57_02785 [Fluviispira multicolorata]